MLSPPYFKVGIIALNPRRGYNAAISTKHKANSKTNPAPIIQAKIDAGPAITADLYGANDHPLPTIAEILKNTADSKPIFFYLMDP